MRVNDYTTIELSEKYQDTFKKIEEKSYIRVNNLRDEISDNKTNREKYKELKNLIGNLRRNYIGIKRKAVYGGITDDEKEYVKGMYEEIAYQASEIAKDDFRMRSYTRQMVRHKPDELIKKYQETAEEDKIDAYKNDDYIQTFLNSVDSHITRSIGKIDLKNKAVNRRLAREEAKVSNSLYRVKIQFLDLEQIEKNSDATLSNFYMGMGIKV